MKKKFHVCLFIEKLKKNVEKEKYKKIALFK
jgi:hypothetical protein